MGTRNTKRVVAEWLRQRNPDWDAARVKRQITRSYVIDEYPNWDDAQVDDEVARRLSPQPGNERANDDPGKDPGQENTGRQQQ